ncbi:MAG: ABC transporter permease [Vicinamibacterales bacterium]
MTEPAPTPRSGEWLAAWLVAAYPRSFRDRFEVGMRDALAADYDAVRRAGWRARVSFWLAAAADAGRFGVAERLAAARRRHHRPSIRGLAGGFMSSLFVDIRDAWRALRAAPVVTAIAVLSLALGIGANTALFSILNGLLLKPLPVAEPQRLVFVDRSSASGQVFGAESWTNPIWEQIRASRRDVFQNAFAWCGTRFDLAERGETDYVWGAWTSGDAFEVLGIHAVLGRTITAADDTRNGGSDGPVAVISYRFWQARFGGAADAVGRQLRVNRLPVTIVGVAPPDFFGADVGRTADVILPIGAEPLMRGKESFLDRRSVWWLDIIGRLKPRQTIGEAESALQARRPQIREATVPQDWSEKDKAEYLSEPFKLITAATGESDLRARFAQPLQTVMVLVGAVLLIACANIANLLLARATTRRRELSLRLALGASRFRLARQLLAESFLLAGFGATLGLVVARGGSALLVSQFSTNRQIVSLDLSLDWRVLGFTTVVTVGMALLFGLVPALGATRVSPHESLKTDARTVAGDRRFGLRNALVVGQVAVSLGLVVGAALFIRTLTSLTGASLGFEPGPLLIADINAPIDRVKPDERQALFERLRDEVAVLPGVAHAGLSALVPIGNMQWNTLIEPLPGQPVLPERDRAPWVNVVSPEWFSTYGMRLIAGRDFDATDRLGTPRVTIVNQLFARKFLAPGSPIGQTVRTGLEGPQVNEYQVIGVVNDAVYRSARRGVEATLYAPIAQMERHDGVIELTVTAASGRPADLIRSVAGAVTRASGDVSLTFSPIAEQLRGSVRQERLVATLSGFFGALALLLAGLGLYGVTSYSVGRRRREMGVRLALGARPSGVVRLVLRRVVWLVLAGVVLGTVLSVWASRFVATLLFGLQPRDPATFIGAAVLLVAVGVLAGWLPARRASRVDPTVALRAE